MAFRLAKAGYGKPDDILAMRLDLVLAAIEYESFQDQYTDALVAIQQEDRS